MCPLLFWCSYFCVIQTTRAFYLAQAESRHEALLQILKYQIVSWLKTIDDANQSNRMPYQTMVNHFFPSKFDFFLLVIIPKFIGISYVKMHGTAPVNLMSLEFEHGHPIALFNQLWTYAVRSVMTNLASLEKKEGHVISWMYEQWALHTWY